MSFVGSTGSTTISFILPGLLYWKVGVGAKPVREATRADLLMLQLTRDEPSANKTLNWAAFVLMVYGIFVFVFWWVG